MSRSYRKFPAGGNLRPGTGTWCKQLVNRTLRRRVKCAIHKIKLDTEITEISIEVPKPLEPFVFLNADVADETVFPVKDEVVNTYSLPDKWWYGDKLNEAWAKKMMRK